MCQSSSIVRAKARAEVCLIPQAAAHLSEAQRMEAAMAEMAAGERRREQARRVCLFYIALYMRSVRIV